MTTQGLDTQMAADAHSSSTDMSLRTPLVRLVIIDLLPVATMSQHDDGVIAQTDSAASGLCEPKWQKYVASSY